MKLIDVGKITVSPFVFDSIQEIRIEKKLNEHSTLYVRGVVKDEEQFTPATGMSEGTSVKCENNGQVYFCGMLQGVKVTCVDAVYRLEAFAVSNTFLLDTVKHKRSFQDNGQSYESIVDTVIAEAGATAEYNADEMTVENIILQYNETDWEFAKRLASHTCDVLIPITAEDPKFHFGVPDISGAKLVSSDFAISRDFGAIRRFDALSAIEKNKNADPLKLTDEDVTLYTVETDEYLCGLGEKLSLNGTELYVCHLLLTLVESALVVSYTLCPEIGVSAPKFYNPAITGLILDGTVLEVENDTLKLKLDDDKERGVEEDTDEAHFFKYATDYSMENHTGWYVMPEEGDTVQLLFPGEDEKYAYAASAIRQADTERTVD
ncbi:MAG: phage late control D family protein, partial [Clostridiales bacterium]|nr:phage late control D family protein [Clostridiales bacterium]